MGAKGGVGHASKVLWNGGCFILEVLHSTWKEYRPKPQESIYFAQKRAWWWIDMHKWWMYTDGTNGSLEVVINIDAMPTLWVEHANFVVSFTITRRVNMCKYIVLLGNNGHRCVFTCYSCCLSMFTTFYDRYGESGNTHGEEEKFLCFANKRALRVGF